MNMPGHGDQTHHYHRAKMIDCEISQNHHLKGKNLICLNIMVSAMTGWGIGRRPDNGLCVVLSQGETCRGGVCA